VVGVKGWKRRFGREEAEFVEGEGKKWGGVTKGEWEAR